MGLSSDKSYDRFREQARRSVDAERMSDLWSRLVSGYLAISDSSSMDHYSGMVDAYSVLTGEPPLNIFQKVVEAAREPVESAASAG